jgi:hypothetical protein
MGDTRARAGIHSDTAAPWPQVTLALAYTLLGGVPIVVSQRISDETSPHTLAAFSNVCTADVADVDPLIAAAVIKSDRVTRHQAHDARNHHSHVRLRFPAPDSAPLTVIIADHPSLFDVYVVGLLYRDCAAVSGVRAPYGAIPESAPVEWNLLLDSLGFQVAVDDAASARILSAAFLAFATGWPVLLQPDTPQAVSSDTLRDLSRWTAELATAVYRASQGGWTVAGSLCNGPSERFRTVFQVSMGSRGRVEAITVLPHDPGVCSKRR